MEEKEIIEEEWDICRKMNWPKNYICKLSNTGDWNRGFYPEKGVILGKWILTIEPISNRAPTSADQRNFITGLIEADKRNDKFIDKETNKPMRPPQTRKRLDMFKNILKAIGKGIEKKDDEAYKNCLIPRNEKE